MHNSWFRNRLAGVIGNFLEHYDSALFGLLASFIAPLFFDAKDPVTALILTYAILPLGLVSRPIGAVVFGWIGDRFGRRYALVCSLSGMAIVTTGMGFLPLYKDVGMAAPILLAVGRMLQSFFAVGEVAGGAVFVLESTPVPTRGFVSGCYDASTIAGILFASALVTLLSLYGDVAEQWRILFWAGGLTAFLGLFLRFRTTEVYTPKNEPHGLRDLWRYKRAFFSMVIVSGFAYTTYSLAFTLMNGYVPLITTLSKTEVMQVNTALLIVDLCLLPFCGYLAMKFGKERQMLLAATSSVFLAIPLFAILEGATLGVVIVVRLAIVVLGVLFAAPYYAWAMELVPSRHRYLLLSLGGTIGSQLIGMPTSAVCIWLYQRLGQSWVPGLYLAAIGSAAAWVVYKNYRKSSNKGE